MNTKKKRNRIILCICSVLVLFATIFAVIPFNKDTKKVYADSVITSYDFVGSNFTTYSYAVEVDNSGMGFYDDLGTVAINVKYSFNVSYDNSNVLTSQYARFLYADREHEGTSFESGVPSVIPKNNTYKTMSIVLQSYTSDNRYVYCDGLALCNSIDFNSNIQSIEFGSYLNNPLPDIPFSWFKYYNYVKYVDNNGNFIVFAIVISFDGNRVDMTLNPQNYAFDYRTYYLSPDFSDNQIYQSGFNSGYLDGKVDGENIGYTNGYNTGKNDGYNLGYNTALENENIYTFTNLIASVIEVPVKTFTSLFNFEILGVNLSGFFLGLLTCCIVIGIVRLIL